MKNSFGGSVIVTLFGESHGETVGAVLDGIAPGIAVNESDIAFQLALRRPQGGYSTARVEEDAFRIISGVYNGRTTGAPICILIPNKEADSTEYLKNLGLARPGHADYAAHMKYHGYEDPRGGGHFSGRLTAPLVAVGAIARNILKENGVNIGTHIKKCAGIEDDAFTDLQSDIAKLQTAQFAALNDNAARLMKEALINAAAQNNSVGGVLETAVAGFPCGVGEPWFDTLEGVLSHALFSVPGVKGVEFGEGFGFADLLGSEANDPFCVQNGRIITKTNRNGGVNGGISNGMPIVFRCAVKPTPSIGKEQQTVNMLTNENALLTVHGRHDPAIIHRARVVIDSVTALVLCDQLALRYGTDWPGRLQ